MSTTNRYMCKCDACPNIIEPGCGTVRIYKGHALRTKPFYARKRLWRGYTATTCVACEAFNASALRTAKREERGRLAARRLGVEL